MSRDPRPLAISTETLSQAPSGKSSTRRTIGLGEAVELRASRPVLWTIPGNAPGYGSTRRVSQTYAQLLSLGANTITATARDGATATVTINVVLPRIEATKTSNVDASIAFAGRFPGSFYGAAMRLRFTFKPLDVSFEGLEFREEDCVADPKWGWYAANPGSAPSHTANPIWQRIQGNNQLPPYVLDTAGVAIAPSMLNWPLRVGGFQWQIPDSYRVVGTTTPVPGGTMTQYVRITPEPDPQPTPPFRGKIKVRKGGQVVERRYP